MNDYEPGCNGELPVAPTCGALRAADPKVGCLCRAHPKEGFWLRINCPVHGNRWEQAEIHRLTAACREKDEHIARLEVSLHISSGAVHRHADSLSKLRDRVRELEAALHAVVAFSDSITMEDCVNDVHVKARAALQPTAAIDATSPTKCEGQS